MPEPIVTPPATPIPGAAAVKPTDPNLLAEAGKAAPAPGEPNVLDDAAKAAQQVKETEDKRLLETPEDQLSAEDLAKKAIVVKEQADAKVKADADAKSKQVPEKYEFKAPEGVTLNQAALDLVTPIFKEVGLSQGNAQKLVDKFIEIRNMELNNQAAAFKEMQKKDYDETVKALGPKYQEELVFVAKIRDKCLSAETRELLDASGLSNNKAFITDLINLGKMISEDKLVTGTPATPAGEKPKADILYPNQGRT